MAIAPTGAIYKSLSFDGKNSRDYGVYITGEAVYNAPGRDVELVTIPGRNGSFALDNGRFENIEVTYPAGIFAYTEEDFRQAISDFRNLLCSRKGYVRLSDEYNPDEYRMAVYKSGLDVSPAQLKAGEFNITFDCKPQRFLVSGEEAVEIGTWGDYETETGDIVEIENDGLLAIKDLTADIEPIQSGSGDPSPSNVRPISGHTDVVVSRTGKNLCDTSLVYNGYINVSQQKIASNANARTLYLPCKPNTTYTVSKQAGQRFVVAESTVIPTNNVVVSNVISDYTASSITITTSASAQYLVAFVYLSTADTGVTADQMLATCQIELGSRATTYEAYQGNTYTTALGTTVYGGTLDVTTGVLTVTHGYADLGDLTWVADAANKRFYTTSKSSEVKAPIGNAYPFNAISTAFKSVTFNTGHGDTSLDGVMYCSGSGFISVRWLAHESDTANAFKTAVTGIKICYELATPTTTTLTAQEIDLLLGQNNIWASSGDVTVEYGQDPNKLINPTLFESKPLLEVEGYGSIKLGDDTIKIENVDMGEVLVHEPYTPSIPNAAHSWFNLETSLLNVGDEITVPGFEITNNMKVVSSWSIVSMKTVEVQSTDKVASYSTGITGQHTSYVKFTPNEFTFNYGTAATSETASIEVDFDARSPGGAAVHPTITFTYYAVYDGANRIDFYFSGNNTYIALDSRVFTIPKITGDSSISALPTVMYIDLDIGEAYGDFSGVIASLNNAVQLPAQLPTLAVGHTDITFDNTITSLKIKPRWFKI